MKQIIKKYPWEVVGFLAILFQTLLTLNHIKFFPFSDHGIFELPQKLNGQRFYRVMTSQSSPHYVEEGILYEVNSRLKHLIEVQKASPDEVSKQLKLDIVAIDRFTLGVNNQPPLFKKERVFEKEK